MPFSKGTEIEKKLYRFLYKQKKRTPKGKLITTQQQLLKDYISEIEQDISIQDWIINYEALKLFNQSYPNRWPRASGDKAERMLYKFCFENRTKIRDGSIEEYKIKLLNDLGYE